MGSPNQTKNKMQKFSLFILAMFAMLAYASAQTVVSRCNYPSFYDYSKSYRRCCYYQNRRQLQAVAPRVRVKLCKRKTGLWCSIGRHSNYDKSFPRGGQYQNRRRTQSVQPRVRVKVCQRG